VNVVFALVLNGFITRFFYKLRGKMKKLIISVCVFNVFLSVENADCMRAAKKQASTEGRLTSGVSGPTIETRFLAPAQGGAPAARTALPLGEAAPASAAPRSDAVLTAQDPTPNTRAQALNPQTTAVREIQAAVGGLVNDTNIHALDGVIANNRANMVAIQTILDEFASLSAEQTATAFAETMTDPLIVAELGSLAGQIRGQIEGHGLQKMLVQIWRCLGTFGNDRSALIAGLRDNVETHGGCYQGYVNRMIAALCGAYPAL
jgi:hypothetical protein